VSPSPAERPSPHVAVPGSPQPPRRAVLFTPRRLLALLVVALATHLVAVWALPRLIMGRVLSSTMPGDSPGAVLLPPPTDHRQRRIVMPSPDLLYAACRFDLSRQPLRIRAEPRTPHYWSIALYAANSDNFFVINDRDAAGQPVDLIVSRTGSTPPGLPAGARVIPAPGEQGLVLMRVLVNDYARERDTVEAARRTLRCEPLGSG